MHRVQTDSCPSQKYDSGPVRHPKVRADGGGGCQCLRSYLVSPWVFFFLPYPSIPLYLCYPACMPRISSGLYAVSLSFAASGEQSERNRRRNLEYFPADAETHTHAKVQVRGAAAVLPSQSCDPPSAAVRHRTPGASIRWPRRMPRALHICARRAKARTSRGLAADSGTDASIRARRRRRCQCRYRYLIVECCGPHAAMILSSLFPDTTYPLESLRMDRQFWVPHVRSAECLYTLGWHQMHAERKE